MANHTNNDKGTQGAIPAPVEAEPKETPVETFQVSTRSKSAEISARYRITKDQLKTGVIEVMETLGSEYRNLTTEDDPAIKQAEAEGAIRVAAKILGKRLAQEAWVAYITVKSGDTMPVFDDDAED